MKIVYSKLLIVALALFICLGAAVTAQAYAIYNHTDYEVCIAHWYSTSGCDMKAHPHSTLNGEHGAGLNRVWASYRAKGNNYRSDEFSIPKGGYIRVYDKELKIYNHHDKRKKTVSIQRDS